MEAGEKNVSAFKGAVTVIHYGSAVTTDQIIAALNKVPKDAYIDDIVIDQMDCGKRVDITISYGRTYQHDYTVCDLTDVNPEELEGSSPGDEPLCVNIPVPRIMPCDATTVLY